MLFNCENCGFVLIDVQDKFLPHIADIEQVIHNANLLNKVAELLDISLVVTEQYPRGLGSTVASIYLPPVHTMFSKDDFSIFEPAIQNHFVDNNIKSLVLYGIEAHVCVLQSALVAIERGYQVAVVADAVASRSIANKDIAITRLRQAGCQIVSAEMIIFELTKSSKHPRFREISKLVK